MTKNEWHDTTYLTTISSKTVQNIIILQKIFNQIWPNKQLRFNFTLFLFIVNYVIYSVKMWNCKFVKLSRRVKKTIFVFLLIPMCQQISQFIHHVYCIDFILYFLPNWKVTCVPGDKKWCSLKRLKTKFPLGRLSDFEYFTRFLLSGTNFLWK